MVLKYFYGFMYASVHKKLSNTEPHNIVPQPGYNNTGYKKHENVTWDVKTWVK